MVALLNDSVGTLAGACYEDPNAKVGVILGTGTNACYVEQVANIATLAKGSTKRQSMVVNTEWGNFTAASLPITQACQMMLHFFYFFWGGAFKLREWLRTLPVIGLSQFPTTWEVLWAERSMHGPAYCLA